jgi:hypothetical protein
VVAGPKLVLIDLPSFIDSPLFSYLQSFKLNRWSANKFALVTSTTALSTIKAMIAKAPKDSLNFAMALSVEIGGSPVLWGAGLMRMPG